MEGTLTREGYDASVRSVRDDLPPMARRSLAPEGVRLLDGFLERSSTFLGQPAPARQAR